MFARILKRMREMVRRGEYVMTTHADEEADADEWSVFDVESAILGGDGTLRAAAELPGR